MFRMKVEGMPDRSRQEKIKERIRQNLIKNTEKEIFKKENRNVNS